MSTPLVINCTVCGRQDVSPDHRCEAIEPAWWTELKAWGEPMTPERLETDADAIELLVGPQTANELREAATELRRLQATVGALEALVNSAQLYDWCGWTVETAALEAARAVLSNNARG